MNALLLSQYKHLEIATLPVPVPGPFDVLVQVAACGICGSDVHGYDGTSGRRIPPIVMGHEAAGVVAAVGSRVSEFSVGDRVTFERGIAAHMMGIDGTWRRDCTMEDVSETGAKLSVDGSVEGLNLKEFFLLLSSTGLAYRRCELAWVNGDQIGVNFLKQGDKKKKTAKRGAQAADV